MRIAVITSAGGRAENQDAAGYSVMDCGLIACVCDGLGGHGGGSVASNAAKEAVLAREGDPGARLMAANEAVMAAHGEYPSMRTTAVALLLTDSMARWAHCGDTRLYRLRAGSADQLTLDHSVPQALVRTGEIDSRAIRHHEDRARLIRALGTSEARWDEGESAVEPGDVYLIATDGFWEPVLEEDMLDCLVDDPGQYLSKLEALLLERVQGEYDNYTALAVFV